MAQVISKDGVAIGYDKVGQGPAVILVPGFAQYRAMERKVMPLLVQLLSPNFTVITYDRRGRGESGDKWPSAVALEVDDLAALIEVAGGQAYLFGMSTGAILALETAAALPRKVLGAALYEPPIDLGKSGDAYRYDHMQMAVLSVQGRSEDMMSDFLRSMGMTAEALESFKANPVWPTFAAVGMTIEHDYRLLSEARAKDTPPERWQNAIMPILILDGDKSFPFIAAAADWVAGGLHNAERLTLAGQGHEVDPSVVAPLLTVFFELGTVVVH